MAVFCPFTRQKMKHSKMTFLHLTLCLLVSSVVFASVHGAAEKPHFDKMFFYSVINFSALLLVLFFLLKKPMQAFFQKRSADTRAQMEKTKKFYDDAEKRYQAITTQLSQASREAQNLIDSLKKDGELEKQRLVAHAKDYANKIKEDAATIVQQELKRAQETLRVETVNLATELATRHVKDTMTSDDHHSLNDEFIAAATHFPKGVIHD